MANPSGIPGQTVPEAPVVVAEVERKFDVPPGFRLPDLSEVPGVARVAPPKVQSLDATYFDTLDLRLVTNKITLRRRTGGDDAGWHLKRPRVDGDRDEVRSPLGESESMVPAALRASVAVHVRDAELLPVVRLQTERTVHRLLDADGNVLAEVAQDEVTATRPEQNGRATRVEAWSELEVELVAGDRDLLDAVVSQVVAAGALPSDSPSKLSRALADVLPEPGPDLPDEVEEGSAGAIVLAHLREHVRRLKSQDPLVRSDEHDAVHQMRVASRRLRSALASFRPLLDRSVTDPIRAELQWLGFVLGGARDAEVIRDHLLHLVDSQPPELVLGPVRERVQASMGARYREAHDRALVDLNSPRYHALLNSLDALVSRPPFVKKARKPADDVLPAIAASDFRRMRRLVDEALAEIEPHHHDELLHEVRKAAKRARYAGESLAKTYGSDAKTWASRIAAIQEALGDHQDSVVIRAELMGLAREAHAGGESAFTYGRLHGLEESRAAESESRFDAAWKAAQDRTIHEWLNR